MLLTDDFIDVRYHLFLLVYEQTCYTEEKISIRKM